MSFFFGPTLVAIKNQKMKSALIIAAFVFFSSKNVFADSVESSPMMDSALGDAVDDGDPAGFPVLMRTAGIRGAVVRRAMYRGSAPLARIYPGAVLRMRRRGSSSNCPKGWWERMGGGFICAENLKKSLEEDARPAPIDDPEIISGLQAVDVSVRGTKIFSKLKDIERKRANTSLLKGSKLIVASKVLVDGVEYFKTRRGWYVEASKTRALPTPSGMLGVDVDGEAERPAAFVISRDAKVFGEPSDSAGPISTLKRWSLIRAPGEESLKADDGWVDIGQGRFVRDSEIARFRVAPRPPTLEPEDRWIAVDLEEQLVHAYEGERLVRIMPCSTGVRGNTKPGIFRVQWKRRMQTMRMKKGQLRIEDVQWVMYYNRKDGIAIHAAYWHDDFGTPVSHGCVNLTVQDARWLFEWSTPMVLSEDSERFPSPGHPGSRVVVFR